MVFRASTAMIMFVIKLTKIPLNLMAVLFDVIKIILNDSLHYYEGKFYCFLKFPRTFTGLGKLFIIKKNIFRGLNSSQCSFLSIKLQPYARKTHFTPSIYLIHILSVHKISKNHSTIHATKNGNRTMLCFIHFEWIIQSVNFIEHTLDGWYEIYIFA